MRACRLNQADSQSQMIRLWPRGESMSNRRFEIQAGTDHGLKLVIAGLQIRISMQRAELAADRWQVAGRRAQLSVEHAGQVRR